MFVELQRLQAHVWDDGGRLRYQAPRGALTPGLLDEMRTRKAEILAFCGRGARSLAPRPPLLPQPRGDDMRLPISLAQQRLWLHDRVYGQDAAYNIALALRLRGALDRDALRAGLEALLRRHEPLRTAFHEEGDQVYQRIDAAAPLPWRQVDLRALAPRQRVDEARRQAATQAAQPFDLGSAPLLRSVLWQLGDDDHVLLLVVHHIVADGRSIEVLADELGACYAARLAGQADGLPALALQFADFAWHQRESADAAALGESLGYWQRRLAGLSPLLALPTDRPRPPVPSTAGAAVHWTFDATLTGRLRRLAREAGATPYVVLLAGVALLLARYCDCDDLAIGCPVTHRDRPELERLVGFFVDTLALRIDLSDPGEPLSFLELLARTRTAVAEGFHHQRATFDQVVEALGIARHAGHAPLVQVSVAMLDARHAAPRLPGIDAEPFELDNPTARYDLSIEIYDGEAAIDLYWIYATALFDRDSVQRMARHLRNLLDAALADPARPVATLAMLDADERQAALEAGNDTAVGWGLADDGGLFVHRLFEAQVRRTPEAVAVSADDRHWRYAALDARADRLARRLRRLGVGPDVLVGVYLERSFDLVAGLLAVLKAGGGYVPLDPDHPQERLALMIEDAHPSVLLTHSALAARLRAGGAQVLCVDSDAGGDGGEGLAPVELRGENLAYVIYTSGSTGVPKGVMIPHRAIGNHMRWMAQRLPLGPGDAVLQKTPCGFDASVWEFYAPLIAGARLVLAAPRRHADPAYLLRVVREQAVTVLQMVPTLLHLLVDHPDFARCPSLRRILSGGETLSADLARRAAATGAEVYNLYGPTEATIDATYCRWQGSAATSAANVPIGTPIANMRAYVLDAAGEPVPTGVAGELCLAGLGLALGYLNRPERTAERFVRDPFSTPAPADARMYRTGDRVRRLADGQLELLGRTDRQVKLQGVRIELDEVEAVLALHPAVAQAAVTLQATTEGPMLVACVVGDPAPDAAELRAYLRARLPDAALPAAFVALPALPTTSSGKVDRQALAALPTPRPTAREPAPARTPTEAALAPIWAELLGRELVGVDDDFLDLGGHSLAAIRVIGRIRQAFGVELSPQLLFEGATVASLSCAVDEARALARDVAADRLRAQIGQMDAAEVRDWLQRKRGPTRVAAAAPGRPT
ncbi:amino acid adenylation domain-containing protein [Variovorax sp. J22R115]|uniref:amino acid adenylation domain-containing protein n=1 Tax=Variovorax sp. J22R115 TaxID=3053509 RepID=UPI00257779E9|nr:amino acid adenylation domain-containing protein [Variovorax sp. J22R115]